MADRDQLIGKMHRACTQIRLAIQRLEVPMPPGENSDDHLAEAAKIVAEVRQEMERDGSWHT